MGIAKLLVRKVVLEGASSVVMCSLRAQDGDREDLHSSSASTARFALTQAAEQTQVCGTADYFAPETLKQAAIFL